MATLLTQTPTNPTPLGFIAPTAGTPLAITNNYTDISNLSVHSVTVQADPANTAGHYVYILGENTATAANTSTGINIVAKLTAGQSYTITALNGNSIFIRNIFIDVSNTGDNAIPSFTLAG